MTIRTAAFPLLLLCLACAGESPDAEPETVSDSVTGRIWRVVYTGSGA